MDEARLTDEVLIHCRAAWAADDLVHVVGLLLMHDFRVVTLLFDQTDVLPLAPPDLLADVCAVHERGKILLEIRGDEIAANKRTLLGGQELLRPCECVDECHKGLVLQENRLRRIHQCKFSFLI